MFDVVEEGNNLVEASELFGRKIEISTSIEDDYHGILHSITDHGVLVKEDESYIFIPWRIINTITHRKKQKDQVEETELRKQFLKVQQEMPQK